MGSQSFNRSPFWSPPAAPLFQQAQKNSERKLHSEPSYECSSERDAFVGQFCSTSPAPRKSKIENLRIYRSRQTSAHARQAGCNHMKRVSSLKWKARCSGLARSARAAGTPGGGAGCSHNSRGSAADPCNHVERAPRLAGLARFASSGPPTWWSGPSALTLKSFTACGRENCVKTVILY